jgi:hypothetical protein
MTHRARLGVTEADFALILLEFLLRQPEKFIWMSHHTFSFSK